MAPRRGNDAAPLENLARTNAEENIAHETYEMIARSVGRIYILQTRPRPMTPSTFQHEAMATFFEITIAGQERDYARQASEAAFRELDRLENTLSRYIESSDIARANRLARGDTMFLTHETLECLLTAADISLVTGRAFDPAYASIRPPDLAPDLLPFQLDPDSHSRGQDGLG